MNNGYSHSDWIDPKMGKISDEVIMALLIASEFGVYKYSDMNIEKQAYDAALQALSKQYYAEYGVNGNLSNAQCGGSCTLEEQISWLTIQEGWYKGSSYRKLQSGKVFEINPLSSIPSNYLDEAKKAASGYGRNGRYWNWGNTSTPENFINYIYIDYHLFIVYGSKR